MINDYVAYYPMNETSGSRVIDMSTNQNEGAATGTTVSAGVQGSARNFNSATDVISCGSGSSIQQSVFTYCAWVNPTGATFRTIIGWSADSGGPQFRVNSDNTLGILNQNVANIGTSSGTVTNSVWSHVAVSYDASGNYAFYINGAASGSGTSLQTFTFSTLKIGAKFFGGGVDERFIGDIDDLRIYKRILTLSDINEVYTFAWQTRFNNSGIRPRPFAPGLAR